MIQVLIDNIDRTNEIILNSLTVQQALTSEVDTANFSIRKYGSRTYVPDYGEEVKIYDDSVQIFGGAIRKINEKTESNADGVIYAVSCSDYTADMNKLLVARTYENKTITEIITDILATYAPTFNASGVSSTFLLEKIVFNQVPVSQCIKRLADLVRFDWYVDETKTVHFFGRNDISAPFDLTDLSGNYVHETLVRNIDGSQIVNRVKVRGGEYDGLTYTDKITVSGDDTKSFILPYKFSNLTVSVNSVAQNVGIDFVDDFTTKDVLYNFQEKTIKFDTPLSAGNIIEYSGNPKVRVFAVAEDPASVAQYGKIEKLIREDDIRSNVVARQRAVAELYAYADSIVDASFYTRTSGLRAGMTINLTSTKRACDDDLIIKSITFKPIDPNTFGYQVNCINSQRYNLLQILAKLLQPKPLDIDETEVSEDIFLDQADLNIVEEHEVVLPVEDDGDITIAENHIDNLPEPEWVVGYYTPTSQLDTKRHGRVGISMRVY